MLNEELKSLDPFSCVLVHDFEVFEPTFPKLSQYRSTWETGISLTTETLDTRVKSHLMRNKKLETLDYFLCVPAPDLGYLSPVSHD